MFHCPALKNKIYQLPVCAGSRRGAGQQPRAGARAGNCREIRGVDTEALRRRATHRPTGDRRHRGGGDNPTCRAHLCWDSRAAFNFVPPVPRGVPGNDGRARRSACSERCQANGLVPSPSREKGHCMTSTPDTIRVFIPLTLRRRNGRPRIQSAFSRQPIWKPLNRGAKTRTCYGPLPAPGVGDVKLRPARLRPSVTLPWPERSQSGLSAARCAWPISRRSFWRDSSPTAGHALSRSRISSPRPSGRGVSKRFWCSRTDRPLKSRLVPPRPRDGGGRKGLRPLPLLGCCGKTSRITLDGARRV